MQTEKSVDSCFMLPVQHDRLGSLKNFWDDLNEKYSADIDGHLKLAGVQKAQVFLQTMPDDRDYMVFYMQSRNSLDRTLKDIFSSDLDCSKSLTDRFAEFTGLDLSKEENMPKPELLMDWEERREFLEERQMLLMPWCVAAPVRQGKTDDLRKLIDDIGKSRMGDVEQLLRDHDVLRAIRCLQHTPQGDFVVGYLLSSTRFEDLASSIASCTGEMCNLAKNAAKEYFGIDLSDPKTLPDLKLLFKWDDTVGFQTAEQSIAYTE
ncbi:hypothetical protein [Methanocella arvoryzae]|uniref:hypothetical protein n=1 Tax=Methanocella arvoryzae TaxID=1175445 RepID=UPI0011D23CC3|nr:hypothetical protein [Methanocella arvoryzae]